MQRLGIDIHNSSKTVVWDNLRIPFKPHDYFSSNTFQNHIQMMLDASSVDFDDKDNSQGYKSQNIKSSLYEQHDPQVVAEQQKHLSSSQRQDLARVLSQFPKLFSGKLGCYPSTETGSS